MGDDVRGYFTKYAAARGVSMSLANRAISGLKRYGIETMAQLCHICQESPKQLTRIRKLGAKSVALVREACEHYLTEITKGG